MILRITYLRLDQTSSKLKEIELFEMGQLHSLSFLDEQIKKSYHIFYPTTQFPIPAISSIVLNKLILALDYGLIQPLLAALI